MYAAIHTCGRPGYEHLIGVEGIVAGNEEYTLPATINLSPFYSWFLSYLQ